MLRNRLVQILGFITFVVSKGVSGAFHTTTKPSLQRWAVGTHNTAFRETQTSWMATSIKDEEAVKTTKSVEETTEKFGLEAGLFQSLKQKDGGESAKSLLKRYGVAYLATSIPLAIVSYAICYVLVSQGVDVAGLLGKVGIESSASAETAGTAAIAYAAHKAASPIRFPPTVILTPIVAKLIGKEPTSEDEGNEKQ